jgi:hypothetical protein
LTVALYLRNEIVQREIQAETPVFHGDIVPGNEPNPELPPDITADMLPKAPIFLWLGDNSAVITSYSENIVFTKGETSFCQLA